MYVSTFTTEQFLKDVGEFLNYQIITDLIAACDFMIPADESIDEKSCSQILIFIRFFDALDNVDLHEIIMKHLESKNLDFLIIRFLGLDGANAMRGEQKGLQRLVCLTASHSQYRNLRSQQLALCLAHLIPFTKNY